MSNAKKVLHPVRLGKGGRYRIGRTDKSTLLTISQAGYQLRASSELSTLDVLPQEGGTYNLNIKLTPTDVPIPAEICMYKLFTVANK